MAYVVLTPRALSAIRHAVAAMLAGGQADGDFTSADIENGHAALAWLNSLPSRPAVVVLTPAEADELEIAAGNSLHDPEEWAQYRNNHGAMERAQSAREKLIMSKPRKGA